MLKFRTQQPPDEPQSAANTVIGVNSNFRGTLMVSGTLRIDGEFEGDVAALTVAMEQGVRFTGRCTMLEAGVETTIEIGAGMRR